MQNCQKHPAHPVYPTLKVKNLTCVNSHLLWLQSLTYYNYIGYVDYAIAVDIGSRLDGVVNIADIIIIGQALQP